MISRTRPYLLMRIFSYSSRHRFSSASLCSAFSSSGNLVLGKGDAGQSKAGTSTYAAMKVRQRHRNELETGLQTL